MDKLWVKAVSGFFIAYLKLLSKTCKIRIIKAQDIDINNSIIGFWHGESFPMYLLMDKWKNMNIGAVVTSDARGDYIAGVMKFLNIKAIRLPNGISARKGISEIICIAKKDEALSICFAIDGPLGPRYQPKKMVFFIAQGCGKKYVSIKAEVKGKVTGFLRWDKYVVPLPFSAITFKINNHGTISKEQLKDFDRLSKNIFNQMEGS